MELQNMIFDFASNKVYSLYQDKSYEVATVSNMATIKTLLDSVCSFDCGIATDKLTIDQYITEPTISAYNLDYSEQMDILTSSISSELSNELATARTEIEADIISQIG